MARVLYVEDNEDNVYMLRHRLKRQGYEVLVAADGERALRIAEQERPEIILPDLSIPGIDGWEPARRLKAAPDTRPVPIIALSAHAMPGDRERALAAGCDDYDTKPVDFGRLLSKMRTLLAATGSDP